MCIRDSGQLGQLLSDEARAQLLGIAVSAIARGVEVDPVTRQVAAGIAERVDEPFAQSRAPRAMVTPLLVLANLVAFGAVVIALGTDELSLVRAGALFRPAVQHGEAWRLLTATFLHAGWVHLAMNMVGLWLIGRLTEGILGRAPFFVTYLVAAFSGSLTSIALNRPGLSVGASGAIFGVVGALLALLIRGGGRFSAAQRRMLVGNLIYLSLLQLVIGLRFELVDNAGHLGGFVGGAIAALLFYNRAPNRRFRARLALVLTIAILPGLGITAAQPTRQTLDETLLRLPQATFRVGGFALTAPAHFVVDAKSGVVYDPYLGIELKPEIKEGKLILGTPQANEPRLRRVLDRATASLRVAAN